MIDHCNNSEILTTTQEESTRHLMKIKLNLKRLAPTRRTVILIGSIGLFLFSVARILRSDTAVLPQAGAAANVEARTSAAEPATRLVAIEQLQVGQRVRADAPTDELDLQFGTEVVSEDWRKLTLLAPKRDGSTADVVLLRPLTWLNEQQAEVGGTVFISVPECGIDGNAQVLAIEPCPEILPGDGRVITGTFRHQVSASISLSIAGQQEPILCTGNHPFWSEDRHDFVRADSLKPNETLRTTSGSTTVTSLTHIPGSTAVYNLEIHGTHVYHVGSSGVLVHNQDPLNCLKLASQAAAGFANGQCKECAEAIADALRKKGLSGTFIDVQTKMPDGRNSLHNIWSDLAGANISTNGTHRAVLIGDTVFDNMHPNGIPLAQWIKDLFSPVALEFNYKPI